MTDINKMFKEIDLNQCGLLSINAMLDWIMRLPARETALEMQNLKLLDSKNSSHSSSSQSMNEFEDLENQEEETLNDDTHKSIYPIKKQLSFFSNYSDLSNFDEEVDNKSEFGRAKITGLRSIRGMACSNFDLPTELIKPNEAAFV